MEILVAVVVIGGLAYLFYNSTKRTTTKIVEPEAPYKVETPVVTPTPAPEPVVGKPADDHVEETAPVTEKPKKKTTKPKQPKGEATKTKPAAKTPRVKKTK